MIALNLVNFEGEGQTFLQPSNNAETPETENEEKEEEKPPGYYEKAQETEEKNSGQDSSSSGSETDIKDSSELNVTEKSEIETSFEGYVNNSERDNGVYLDRNPVPRETNSVWVYSGGNPVSGTEVLVNGKSIGKTSRFGDVLFTVPQADKLVVRTTTENLGTVENAYKVE